MDQKQTSEILRLLAEATKETCRAMAMLEDMQKRDLNRAADWSDSVRPRHDPAEYSLQVKPYKKRRVRINHGGPGYDNPTGYDWRANPINENK